MCLVWTLLLFYLFATSFASKCVTIKDRDNSYQLTLADLEKAPVEKCDTELNYQIGLAVPCVTVTRKGVFSTGCFNKSEHEKSIEWICGNSTGEKSLMKCDYEDYNLYRQYDDKNGNSACCCFGYKCNEDILPNIMLRSRDKAEIDLPKWRKEFRRFFAIIFVITAISFIVAVEAVIEEYIRCFVAKHWKSYSSKRLGDATPLNEPFANFPSSGKSSLPSTNPTQRSTARQQQYKTDKTESTMLKTAPAPTPMGSTQKSVNGRVVKSSGKIRTPRTSMRNKTQADQLLPLQTTPRSTSKRMKKQKALMVQETQPTVREKKEV